MYMHMASTPSWPRWLLGLACWLALTMTALPAQADRAGRHLASVEGVVRTKGQGLGGYAVTLYRTAPAGPTAFRRHGWETG
ncbi:hypothetical protein [Geminicoccus roseus]|uniref:hypothetical protein n=1 Tax=Geminicoccus roseus TaxID=404900 RepID=UPI0004236D9E|nr:hypothetical protein [Geminicoccus roseus]